MKIKIALLVLAFNFLSVAMVAQEEEKKGGISYRYKMQDARHKYLAEGNVRVALNIYRELLKDHPNDAKINYRLGECYYKLKNYELAVQYYKKAKEVNAKVDDELYYNLGQAYHKNGQLDESLEAYQMFNETASKKDKELNNITQKIEQVNYAKQMIANPVKVKIENLGKNINSRGGDYAPSISADGKTMIFTSRRADTKGGRVDKASDFKYFEDIYISEWDSVNNKWGRSESVEGDLNTNKHDACLSISPDGNQIFIYKNDGNSHIGDIFISKKNDSTGVWENPKSLGRKINSSYFESSACLSADGNKLYFVSERIGEKDGAQGKGDIYVSERKSRTRWGAPKNLGAIINTPLDEISVFIHPDGKTLFFSSKGHNSIGGLDVFMSKLQDDGRWSKPKNLGYPINSVRDDVHFVLSTDGKTAYYSAVKSEGLGERDIYKIDLTDYPKLSENAENLSVLKGQVLNGQGKVLASIEFKTSDGKLVRKISCDDNGKYFITLLGGNKYTATISAPGYNTKTIDVDLLLGKGKTHVQTNVFSLGKVGAPEE